ncbi:MAG TPA: hypothetical protein DCQ31_13765 [Bacteroidales bacterium]|nr:hypothetical protein [Bacteroidales bacterium]
MKKIILFAVFMLLVQLIEAQVIYPDEPTKDKQKKTTSVESFFVEEENLELSIPMYEKLLIYEPENSALNYKLGFCYLNSVLDKERSIDYFLKAIKFMNNTDSANTAPKEVYFYLARAYRVTGKYLEAIDALEKLQALIPENDKPYRQKIKEEMEMVEAGVQGTSTIKASTVRRLYAIAEQFIEEQNFEDAISTYKKLLIVDNNNSEYNYKMGLCYLNTVLEKQQAINYLLKAVNLKSNDSKLKRFNAPMEAYFYLGQAYRVNYKYDEALNVFKFLQDSLPKEESVFLQLVEREVHLCNNVKRLLSNPMQIQIEPVSELNSEFTDHSPVISFDQKILIFTSRRKNKDFERAYDDGQYDEDIYISVKDDDGDWTSPEEISSNINTNEHEASIGLSGDGQELYIYKDDGGDGNIYVSKLKGTDWSKPEKLGSTINTKYNEAHATISPDGQILYFTSDRKGGFGGKDIYLVRKLPNGDWGKAENLGPIINTQYDEEAPYIAADGQTLYFSSQGHSSMGGFDIFQASISEEGSWSAPTNLGFPLNTPQDDIYFVPTADGSNGFYSSLRDDSFGEMDIYSMIMSEKQGSGVTILTGKFSICTGKLPVIEISVKDSETGETIGNYRPNEVSGRFVLSLNTGRNYFIQYRADGKVFRSEPVEIPENSPFRQVERNIKLRSGTACDAQFFGTSSSSFFGGDMEDVFIIEGVVYDEKIEITNILFPFGKANKIDENKDLDFLAAYLKENRTAVIEIGAFADAVGAEDVNLRLTEKRAQVVVDYLMERGALKKQLVAKGYGEANPIALNENPDGTWNKEAQAYNRRIEFKVLTQGESKLWVNPNIFVPEEYRIKKEEE